MFTVSLTGTKGFHGMKKNVILNVLLVVFIIIFLVSGFFLVRYIVDSVKQKNEFDALANIVNQAQKKEPVLPDTPAPSGEEDTPQPPAYVKVTNPKTGEEFEVLQEYAELYNMNSDVIGWMRIDGTKINYPVMQTPDNTDYYLHKNFNKEYSAHGCFYAREACDINAPSDNITVYGHNMRDGSMMAALHKYKDKSFWQSHPTVVFDSLTEHRSYEIMAVFVTTATAGKGFSYHTFVNAANEAQFDHFVLTCKDLSFYDTGITAHYGDKLITLSTCDYTQENGRLVVVAKQIPNS